MSCIQVVACLSAVNFRNIYHMTGVQSMPCVTPTHIQYSKTSLKMASKSTYQQRAPVCLFGDKGESENTNEASPWKALEKAMGSLKKEQSVEDLLKQQMAKEEYFDDGGSNGRNRPGGGGGGGSDGFGESEDEGFAGIMDEVLQVTLATLGFVFLYIYIIEGEDITRLAKDFIKFLFGGKKSIRLTRVIDDWRRFFQRLTRKTEVEENWLEYAIINTPTSYDSPEKYKHILRSYLASRSDPRGY